MVRGFRIERVRIVFSEMLFARDEDGQMLREEPGFENQSWGTSHWAFSFIIPHGFYNAKKNYLDGSISPCTHAFDGGRNWSSQQKSNKHKETLCGQDLVWPGFKSGSFLLWGRGADHCHATLRKQKRGEEQGLEQRVMRTWDKRERKGSN